MSHGKIGTCKFTFINVQFTAVFVVYLAVCCNQLLLEVNWSFWIYCPCEVEVKSPYYSAEMHTQFTCRQTTWERGRIYCLKDLSFKQAKTASGKFFFSHFEMWNITYPPHRPHSWRQLGALDAGTRKKSPRFKEGMNLAMTWQLPMQELFSNPFISILMIGCWQNIAAKSKVGSLRACWSELFAISTWEMNLNSLYQYPCLQ